MNTVAAPGVVVKHPKKRNYRQRAHSNPLRCSYSRPSQYRRSRDRRKLAVFGNSGVISISAIRACRAAAFDDGRKKLKFSKNFFFFFKVLSNAQIAANLRLSTQNVVKNGFWTKKSFFGEKCSGQFFQKSDLSADRRPARNSRKIAVTPLFGNQ